jgi:hypothetical protein
MKKKGILFTLLICLQLILFAQKECPVNNNCFKDGEQLTYEIQYNWGPIWVTAGEATFSAFLKNVHNRPVYHFIGSGTTLSQYDWFYKVRDRYESYADTATLAPLRFIRDVEEGSTFMYDDYVFNRYKSKVYTFSKRKKSSTQDSITITACTKDVLTAIFYARCLDFSKYYPNDLIPITFVLDGEVYPSYIKYLGIEIIESHLLGKVRCVKFSPKLIEGTIFKGGEEMTVWVTDDQNKMPVYVETPILVGKVKVSLSNYSGIKNPITCLVPKTK